MSRMDDQGGAEPAHLREKYDEEICQLYQDEAGRLRRHLARRGASPHLADDILQDSVMATRLRWHVVRAYEWPPGYLYRVAENRLKRLLGRERTMGEPYPDPYAAAGGRSDHLMLPDLELRLVLDEAIKNLSVQVGRVVRLHYLADKRVSDVARILNISENTVKGYLLEGRRRLRQDLGEDIEGWTEGDR